MAGRLDPCGHRLFFSCAALAKIHSEANERCSLFLLLFAGSLRGLGRTRAARFIGQTEMKERRYAAAARRPWPVLRVVFRIVLRENTVVVDDLHAWKVDAASCF